MSDDTTTADDGLPLDPARRHAAVEAQFDDYRARIEALTPEDTMENTERDEIEDVDAQQRQARAQSATIQTAVIRVLDVTGGFVEPLIAAHALAMVFRSTVAGVLKLDPTRIPWALALVGEVNQHIAEAVAALAPPSDTKH